MQSNNNSNGARLVRFMAPETITRPAHYSVEVPADVPDEDLREWIIDHASEVELEFTGADSDEISADFSQLEVTDVEAAE